MNNLLTPYMWINLAVLIIYIIFIISGLKNGFLYQLVAIVYNIFAIFISWFISPILASKLPIIKMDMVNEVIDISPILNTITYFVIIYIILRLIYLLIKPLLKSISKIPILGSFNKIGGVIIGIIDATIIILILSMLLNLNIINNSNEIKENTVFKYCDTVSDELIKFAADKIDFSKFENEINNFDIDDLRDQFTKWLIEKDILDE